MALQVKYLQAVSKSFWNLHQQSFYNRKAKRRWKVMQRRIAKFLWDYHL